MRTIKSSNDFFDILDGIKGGAIVTIGYVTSAGLNVPVIKKKNPKTNREKGYNDYSMFQNEGENEISALVKLTSYNFNYRNRQSVHDEYYNRVKPETNAIRQKYGLPDVGTKKSYKTTLNFGENGQEVYGGQNQKLFGNSYSPQNMYKPLNIKSSFYTVGSDGHIMKELNNENVIPYLTHRVPDGVNALKKLGADDQKIQNFIKEIDGLKFKYRNFEANSILYIIATVKGEKLIYINDNLQRCVDDIDINPQDFIKIANERYQKDLAKTQQIPNNENVDMKENVTKLSENDFHYIISEAVKRIISEKYIRQDVDSEWEWTDDEDDNFIPHGYRTISNAGGLEMQLSDKGDTARIRNTATNTVSDWLEIQFGENGVAYVIDENGDEERLCDYMRY